MSRRPVRCRRHRYRIRPPIRRVLPPDEGAPGDAGTVLPTSPPHGRNDRRSRYRTRVTFWIGSHSDWTPLSFATLFTEGWNQPFVFSPASDSGALRQEWINAANGVFYRQWVLDYNFRDHATPSGNRDIGTWSIFAPLSRRLELYISIPFVDYHAVENSSASRGGRASLNPGPGARGRHIRRPSETSPSRRR